MKIITSIEQHDFRPSVATIGFFDGMHCGHRFLVHQVTTLARERGLDSLLISFDRHPRQVMQADYRPQLLSPFEEKCLLLEQSEADHAVLLHFDLAMSALSAYEFMRDVLLKQLHVRVLLIGYDHHFGHGACDTFEDYVCYGKELGIEVVQSCEYQDEGQHVSSSVIRKALLSGDLDFATHALQRYYSLCGAWLSYRFVIRFSYGKRIGRFRGKADSGRWCVCGVGGLARRSVLSRYAEYRKPPDNG